MAWYSGLSELADTDKLADEVSALRKELALTQRKLAKRGRATIASASDRGGDFYEELRDRFIEALPMIQKQTQVAGRFARDNRTAMIVGTAAAVGVLVLLAARRR
jgi:ElaB/YqjD/DUF883 family membrane-anchored ribosome-binding protein